MGFRRLSILDLSDAGHQPMVSEDGQYVLVFNGEIFNYVELRAELRQLGHQFRSSGDSEVLLAAYRQWGRECLPKLNGMWAFVIYDRRHRRMFGSRDRFGVKPLYYSRNSDGHTVRFRDQGIASIWMSPGGELNWRTAARFLLEGRLDSQVETFYEGIQQISPGSGFEVTLDGAWHQWSFWSLDACRQPCLIILPRRLRTSLKTRYGFACVAMFRSEYAYPAGWIRRPSFVPLPANGAIVLEPKRSLSKLFVIWQRSLMSRNTLPIR